jgi:hypothetical protein
LDVAIFVGFDFGGHHFEAVTFADWALISSGQFNDEFCDKFFHMLVLIVESF